MKVSREIPMYRMIANFYDCPCEFTNDTGSDPSGLAGATLHVGDQIYIYIKKSDSLAVADIAHESFHCASSVADYVGLDYVPNTNNEHIAYLITWFSEFIVGCINGD